MVASSWEAARPGIITMGCIDLDWDRVNVKMDNINIEMNIVGGLYFVE